MTVTNREISRTLSRYLAIHPGEQGSLAPLAASLAADAEVISRLTVPGHVTCSAAVINNAGRVLIIRHNALNRWLLPGGHLDPADHGLLAAAQRELAEETGSSQQQATSPPAPDDLPFDIDLHLIPANRAKSEPAHWHADFRFAFFVTDPAVLLLLEEVSGYAWQPPSSLQTTRLADKVARLPGVLCVPGAAAGGVRPVPSADAGRQPRADQNAEQDLHRTTHRTGLLR